MMIRSYIRLGNLGRLLFSLVAGWLVLMAISSQAQMTLNVTNFGARGDAVQFYVNTVGNSVVVTTTNQLSSADIGKAIEVFGVGTQTSGIDSYGNNTNGNQDLVATITNVVNGTNIYISQVCQATLKNTFATYGHNNQTNFANAIAAASGTNTVINIPAGKYLFLCTYDPTDYANVAIELRRGGIHLIGAGTNSTTLLSQGAWTLQRGAVWRGFLFSIVPPVINDYPVSFENLTLDGGVQQGNNNYYGFPANQIDGRGWDITHDAIEIQAIPGPTFTHQLWTNLVITHWRGEMVKSNDGSTNGNLSIFNCTFADGNATAINIYPSLNISNCVFANLFQIGEYYQKYSTNISYFQNNFVTNITGNGFALNGGKGNNPPFVIQGNTFCFPGNGYNGIETTPADNVSIISNKFVFQQNGGNAIVLGCAGYQGTFDNSNIVIAANNFVEPSAVVEIVGGISSTDVARVEDVQVYGNSLTMTNGGGAHCLMTYGWTTNVHFFNNDFFSNVTNGSVGFSSGSYGGQYGLIGTNNLYYSPIYDLTGQTNYISYANGSRFKVIYAFNAATVYALTDTNASQIPPGAQILIQNDNSSSNSIPVYLNSALTSGPIIVPYGQMMVASWTNGVWANNAPPVIQVTPGSMSYGTLLSGTSVTNSFMVQNVRGGILSGTASVGAPFSILSGGSYNLGSNQSQTVTMVFSPSGAGNYSQNVTFTGGGGTNAVVSGSATNAPISPAIRVTPATIVYGTLLSGTSKTNSFTVQNVGGGTLSGTASVGAPFKILSGGSYSLGSNQSQTVTMVFNPVMAGNYSQNVSLSGGGGTNTIVSGNATNVPPVLPTVSAIGANVPDADTNKAGFQVYVGTTVQLSASASAPNGDALTWQWSYSLNGGTQTVYQSGSGTAPTASFTYTDGTAGNTYVWNLQVTDNQTQLSAQSQLTLSVTLKPPMGFRVLSN